MLKMNGIQTARDALAEALREAGHRVYTEPAEAIETPALAIGIPSLTWNGPGPLPSDATFTVGYIPNVDRADHLQDDMMENVTVVSEVLDNAMPSQAVIRQANPGTWPNGGADLPAYLIEIEVAL